MTVSLKKFTALLFSALLLTCLSLQAVTLQPAQTVPHKKILFLNSYHSGYKGSDDTVLRFSETLRSAFPDAEIKIEYLDSKYHGRPQHCRTG